MEQRAKTGGVFWNTKPGHSLHQHLSTCSSPGIVPVGTMASPPAAGGGAIPSRIEEFECTEYYEHDMKINGLINIHQKPMKFNDQWGC